MDRLARIERSQCNVALTRHNAVREGAVYSINGTPIERLMAAS
ncbi:MAG: hypothetical protein M0Z84_08845 [Gammaproteobacteria bacterium]|nr:hypothetical protein [Gammaproteobacteria bacterium]